MIEATKKIVVAGLYAQRVVDTAAEMSVPVAELAAATGIAETTLSALPEQLAGEAYLALMKAAASLSGDPDFGLHVGERISPASYPVLGYTLMSCRSLSHALVQVTRYETIIHNLGSFGLRVEDGKMKLVWSNALPATSAHRHVTESVLVGVKVFAERLTERTIPVESISFTHPAPDNLKEIHRVLGEEVTFGADINEVTCSAEILEWPIVQADESLFPLLKEHAERLLALRSEAPGIVDEVRQALGPLLSTGDVKLKHVAEKLTVHPRTLQRRLSDADSSFQEILELLRQDMAKHYLRDSEVSLGEVAFLLGYHDQSSFNRAFKEWLGTSPSTYRETALVHSS